VRGHRRFSPFSDRFCPRGRRFLRKSAKFVDFHPFRPIFFDRIFTKKSFRLNSPTPNYLFAAGFLPKSSIQPEKKTLRQAVSPGAAAPCAWVLGGGGEGVGGTEKHSAARHGPITHLVARLRFHQLPQPLGGVFAARLARSGAAARGQLGPACARACLCVRVQVCVCACVWWCWGAVRPCTVRPCLAHIHHARTRSAPSRSGPPRTSGAP
jgi:hypothetical protein